MVTDAMFEEVECYGGPACGEKIAVDPLDPPPKVPRKHDGVTTWYRLRTIIRGGETRFRYDDCSLPEDPAHA
jgi:hypothetical protein